MQGCLLCLFFRQPTCPCNPFYGRNQLRVRGRPTKNNWRICAKDDVGISFGEINLRCKDHVVLQLQLGLVILVRFEVNDQVGLHSENGVGSQPGVVLGVQLSRAALEVGVGDHDVDVGGAHGVAVHHLEQLPARAVLGQAVGGRVQAVEPVFAVLVGTELASQVVGRLVLGVLEVVLSVGAGLPDVEDGAGDGLAGQEICDGAVHLADAAGGGGGVDDDAAAEVTEGRVGRPEGPQDGGGGGVDVGLGDDLVGNLVDEPTVWKNRNMVSLQSRCVCVSLSLLTLDSYLRLETENVAESVGLVSCAVGLLVDSAHGVDVGNTSHPLVNGELDLTGEVVDVADHGAQDLPIPRGGLGAHAVDNGIGEVGVESVSRRHCGWMDGCVVQR